MNKKSKLMISVLLIMSIIATLTLVSCGSKDNSSFEYWNEGSEALATLQEYVEDVTDDQSDNFIPVEDRIAVFDMDGTLYCETAPIYLEDVIFMHRVLEDKTYKAPKEIVEYAKEIKKLSKEDKPFSLEGKFAEYNATVFKGMTTLDFECYVKDYISSTKAPGCGGLTYGEVFFQPMLEVVDYLNENDFTTYVCSGTDRSTCRALLDEHVNIKANNTIGCDIAFFPDGYDGPVDASYEYTYPDKMVRSDKVISPCWEGDKANRIAVEIGKQPVLVFGNSLGDSSMATYATDDNQYKSMAFMVKADDPSKVRTFVEEYEKRAKIWEKNKWTIISMKKDFKSLFLEK